MHDVPDRRLKTALAMLLAALARRNSAEIDNAACVKVYLHDLSDLPIDAVERACSDYRRGVIGDGVWAPTSAQIRQAALSAAARMETRETLNRPMIAGETDFRQIQAEARRIAVNRGITDERELQTQWGRFAESFRALGATKLRWNIEWARWCDGLPFSPEPAQPILRAFDDIYPPDHRERMVEKWQALVAEITHAPDPCTPKTCKRRHGEPCPHEGLRVCHSHDAAVS